MQSVVVAFAQRSDNTTSGGGIVAAKSGGVTFGNSRKGRCAFRFHRPSSSSSSTTTTTTTTTSTGKRGRHLHFYLSRQRKNDFALFSKTSSSSSSSRSRGSVYCSSSASSSSSSSPVTTDDLDKLKVPELRERLAARNLKVSGKKQELIARLRGGGGGGEEEERETRSSGSISNEEEKEENNNNNNNNNINNGESTSDSSNSSSSSSSSGSKQLQQQQEQQQQPAVAFKRNVMNGKASPASFATEDLRLELDIAKDREDGKGFTGLEITWLGTSSGAPTFSRNVSATAVRTKDEVWLFDCGEATQHQMMRCGVKLSKISRIFITHMHGDHIFGLPGLLCAISACRSETYKQKDEKKKRNGNNGGPRDAFKDQEPLVITGPPGLKAFVHAAMTYSRTQLGTDIVVTELTTPSREKFEKCNGKVPAHVAVNEDCARKKRGNLVFGDCWPQEGMNHVGFPRYKAREWDEENQHIWPSWVVLADENVCIRAAPLRHPVPCFGYVIEEKDRDGHMKVEWLTEQGLPPSPLYKNFKAGKSVESPKEPGRMITPEEAMELPRPGRKIVMLGDTCGSEGIAKWAYGADVLVHESTFNAERAKEALFKGHSTSAMAGSFAKRVNARTLVLTHFSARYSGNSASNSSSASSNSKYDDGEVIDDDDENQEDNEAPPDHEPSEDELVQERMHVGVLVEEAAKAKGDARVLAASDLFTLAIPSREETDELDKRREHKLGPRSAWFNDKNNRYVLPKMTFPGRNEFLNNKLPSPNNNRSNNNNNNNNRDRDHGAAPRRR